MVGCINLNISCQSKIIGSFIERTLKIMKAARKKKKRSKTIFAFMYHLYFKREKKKGSVKTGAVRRHIKNLGINLLKFPHVKSQKSPFCLKQLNKKVFALIHGGEKVFFFSFNTNEHDQRERRVIPIAASSSLGGEAE